MPRAGYQLANSKTEPVNAYFLDSTHLASWLRRLRHRGQRGLRSRLSPPACRDASSECPAPSPAAPGWCQLAAMLDHRRFHAGWHEPVGSSADKRSCPHPAAGQRNRARSRIKRNSVHLIPRIHARASAYINAFGSRPLRADNVNLGVPSPERLLPRAGSG